MGPVHEDQSTFLIMSRSVLRRRNVLDKSFKDNQNTFYVQYIYSEIVPYMT